MNATSRSTRSRASVRTSSLATSVLLAASLGGCDDSGVSLSSAVQGPRILAVASEPPVVTFGQETELVPLIAGLGENQGVELAMRACDPWRVISDPTSDCGPAVSQPLVIETFALGPGARLSTNELLSAFPPPEWYEPPAPAGGDGSDTNDCAGPEYDHISVTVVVDALIDDGPRLLATRRVRISALPVERTNPILEEIHLDERISPANFAPGTRYSLMISPRRDSLDTVCDADDQSVLEPVRVYLYANAGQLEDPYIDVEYTVEGRELAEPSGWRAPDDGDATIWVVALDDDGGVGWQRFDLAAGGGLSNAASPSSKD